MIERVVGVPFTLEMRMRTGCVCPTRMLPDGFRRSSAGDFHVTEDAVMPRAADGIGEEAEKEEYIADADAMPSQMALCRSALAKPAQAVREHRVIVAQRVSRYPTPRRFLD